MKRWISLLIATQLLTATAFAKGRIQNEDIKSLTDITAAVLTTTGNLTSGNACIVSPGSTSGLATGLFIYDTTTSANVSSGSTIAGLPGSCSAGQIQMSATAAGSGTGDTLTFGGQGSQLINDSKIWLTSINPNQQLSTALSKGAIGGSGGSKNYLTTYVASSGAGSANTGNGNFEQGTTTGWSLAHSSLTSLVPSSTASAGTAFDSTHGGSSASGNLSLNILSSGQIQGNYSGSLASSASSTAGDLLISSAFFIDKQDQAKMMTFKFYYNLNSGAANTNFSGSSSNTFAVYIYSVTDGSWIQPAGVYNLVQNSGSGYATGTFQTTSSGTKYQIALVNINASSGAYTLYVDDFSVGPQTAPSGPVITDWQSFPMTVTSTGSSPTKGTASQDNAKWRRVGDTMEIAWDYQQTGAGSSGTGNYLLALPNGASIDTTKVSVTANSVKAIVGHGTIGQPNSSLSGTNSGDNDSPLVVLPYDSTHLGVAVQGADNTGFGSGGFIMLDYSKTMWNSGFVNFATANFGITLRAAVPIAGWSSNNVMSNDTDTRVVALQYKTNGGGSLTANTTNIDWTTKAYDTNSAWNGTTFTCPVSGIYEVIGNVSINPAAANSYSAYVNGSANIILSGIPEASGSWRDIHGQLSLNAGDTVTIRSDSNVTLNPSSTRHWIAFKRLSGPAVVAASEKVFAIYTNNGGTTLTASTTNADFSTKVVDSHAAWNGTVFTSPVSGMYSIKGSLSINANTAMSMFAYVNGSKSYILTGDEGTSHVFHSFHGDFKLNAGDTLSVRSDTGVTLSNSNGQFNHWISILSQ